MYPKNLVGLTSSDQLSEWPRTRRLCSVLIEIHKNLAQKHEAT
jgi:hypothetical protein